MSNSEFLESVSNNTELLEVARKAIEDALIEMRDSRLSVLFRNNGLVIKEKDGSESSIIRLGPEGAVAIALRAIAIHLQTK